MLSTYKTYKKKYEIDRFIEQISSKCDDSLFLFDLSDVIEKYKLWMEKMPKIVPYYAVKANSYPLLIKLLINLGTGFDCATKGEMKKVLSLGGKPEKIIFANPTKFPSHIQYAKDNGIDLMTFDSVYEIYKTKEIFPEARLVLRIRCDSSSSKICLGQKYGCEPSDALHLLKTAKDFDMNVIGLCFHVGTENKNSNVFKTAISLCYEIFEEAKTLNYNFTFLDIGGGFLGDSPSGNLQKDANVINEAIEKYFNGPNMQIISEPGRYFCETAFTLITKIMSLRDNTKDGKRFYYLNDGVYKNFGSVIYENRNYNKPQYLKHFNTKRRHSSKLWGNTLDSIDIINESISLPILCVGDLLIWKNMGAYTLCLNTKFHDFEFTEIFDVIQEKDRFIINELY